MITCAGCPLRNTGIKEFLFPFSKFSPSQKVRLIISQSAPPPAWLLGKKNIPQKTLRFTTSWVRPERSSGRKYTTSGQLESLTDVVQREGVCRARMEEGGWPWVWADIPDTVWADILRHRDTPQDAIFVVGLIFFSSIFRRLKKNRDLKLLQPVTTNSTSSLQQQGPVNRQKRAGRQVTIKALLNSTFKSLPIVT